MNSIENDKIIQTNQRRYKMSFYYQCECGEKICDVGCLQNKLLKKFIIKSAGFTH